MNLYAIEISSSSNSLDAEFDDATAVEVVEAQQEKVKGAFFNLAGQQVTAPVKGQVYVVGGKKVIF